MAKYVIIAEFALKPESRDRFLELVRENAKESLHNEKGCRRFDVCVPRDGSAQVFLYEIYDDEAAFDAHIATGHFKAFTAAATGMVENRRILRLELLGA